MDHLSSQNDLSGPSPRPRSCSFVAFFVTVLEDFGGGSAEGRWPVGETEHLKSHSHTPLHGWPALHFTKSVPETHILPCHIAFF